MRNLLIFVVLSLFISPFAFAVKGDGPNQQEIMNDQFRSLGVSLYLITDPGEMDDLIGVDASDEMWARATCLQLGEGATLAVAVSRVMDHSRNRENSLKLREIIDTLFDLKQAYCLRNTISIQQVREMTVPIYEIHKNLKASFR